MISNRVRGRSFPWPSRRLSPARWSIPTRNRLPKVLLLFGPTGVGKTELIRNLFPNRGEIISADALQVYRGLDIGTAKPNSEIRTAVPHHLIDILDPREAFTAGDFVRRTDAVIPRITGRDRLPVISGGTAFYMKSWLVGLPDIPPVDRNLRASLKERSDSEGIAAIRRELKAADPVSAARISSNDNVRVLRALEVFLQTGKPFSSFEVTANPREDCDVLSIELTRDREDLYARIELRVERMFEQGLEDEVRGLKAAGLTADDPGMKGIGYREFLTDNSEEIKERIKRHTRRYAKRQLTFFRSLPRVTRLPADDVSGVARAVEAFQGS